MSAAPSTPRGQYGGYGTNALEKGGGGEEALSMDSGLHHKLCETSLWLILYLVHLS